MSGTGRRKGIFFFNHNLFTYSALKYLVKICLSKLPTIKNVTSVGALVCSMFGNRIPISGSWDVDGDNLKLLHGF